MNLNEFKEELASTVSPGERMKFVRKHFFHGLPYVFKGRENDYYEFRQKVADHFGIDFYEVFVVGSAKLGFSYIKKKLFSYESDVDLVLVNEELFEEYYKIIRDFQYRLDEASESMDVEEKVSYEKFLRYLVKGWMRPDLLPISSQMKEFKRNWFDFFSSISNNKSEVGNYKVTAGLYKTYDYLEKYHSNAIEKHYKQLKIEANNG